MLHALLLIGGAIAVGAGALFVRLGLDAGMTPLQIAVWRLTIASVCLAAWSAARAKPEGKLAAGDKGRLVLGGVCLAVHFVTWMTSLEYVSVARSTLLVSTTPVFAGLLGLFVPSLRPPRSFWIGLGIAVVGVVLVTWTKSEGPRGGGSFWIGDGMALLGALLILPYLLFSQKVQAAHGTARTVTWIYGSAAVSLWIMALAMGQAMVPSSAKAWASVVGMAVVAQLIGHTLFNSSLRHFTAGQVSTAALLEPVSAGLLAWILLAEAISPLQLFGGAVLLAGIAITLKRQADTSAEPAAST